MEPLHLLLVLTEEYAARVCRPWMQERNAGSRLTTDSADVLLVRRGKGGPAEWKRGRGDGGRVRPIIVGGVLGMLALLAVECPWRQGSVIHRWGGSRWREQVLAVAVMHPI